MPKAFHEIRDPVHVFIRMDDDERRVVDSRAVQRLRQIHQLALTYLLYPGATHRRFEHSLGVMDLAGRVFDVICDVQNIDHKLLSSLSSFSDLQRSDGKAYWRKVVRMAALCHDLGHLPFSHAAEHELLPEGWTHERLTVELVYSPEMAGLWNSMTPPLRPTDIAKLAVGKKILQEESFSDLHEILSEVVVSDAFGVDRMDYLLRDSLHTGVAYGRFDHFRLVDTLRILPPPEVPGQEPSIEPSIGVEEGGLHSSEALLLARFFMFTQVYYHPVRRIYDVHLQDFLRAWLPGGQFSVDIEDHLAMTDVSVLAAMTEAARDSAAPGHDAARRIMHREHFKLLWQLNPLDDSLSTEAGALIYQAACREFGEARVRRNGLSPKSGPDTEFPVLLTDGRVASAFLTSTILPSIPNARFDYVYVEPTILDMARGWLSQHKQQIFGQQVEG